MIAEGPKHIKRVVVRQEGCRFAMLRSVAAHVEVDIVSTGKRKKTGNGVKGPQAAATRVLDAPPDPVARALGHHLGGEQSKFDRDELLVARLAKVFDAAARYAPRRARSIPRCTPQMRPVLIHASTKSCVLRRVKSNSAPEANSKTGPVRSPAARTAWESPPTPPNNSKKTWPSRCT